MRRIAFILLAFIVVFASCKKQENIKEEPKDLYLGLWEITHYESQVYDVDSDKLLEEEFIEFDKNDFFIRVKDNEVFQLMTDSEIEFEGTYVRVDNKTLELEVDMTSIDVVYKGSFDVETEDKAEMVLEGKYYVDFAQDIQERLVVKYYMKKKY